MLGGSRSPSAVRISILFQPRWKFMLGGIDSAHSTSRWSRKRVSCLDPERHGVSIVPLEQSRQMDVANLRKAIRRGIELLRP